MKLFKLSEVESLATTKWGSMEKLETEQEKRRQQNSKLEKRKEEEKRRFWDCKELFEPLKRFMVNMELPTERVSSYFKDKGDNRQSELINKYTGNKIHSTSCVAVPGTGNISIPIKGQQSREWEEREWEESQTKVPSLGCVGN